VRANQLNSPLLRLPGEIRNRIYEYTFSESVVVVSDGYANRSYTRKNNTPLHILATCQQIRHEATSFFWKHCTIDAQRSRYLGDVKKAMGSENCARVTSLNMREGAVAVYIRYNLNKSRTKRFHLEDFPAVQRICVWRVGWGFTDEQVTGTMRFYLDGEDVEVVCKDLY
jgi:hypothetical protein